MHEDNIILMLNLVAQYTIEHGYLSQIYRVCKSIDLPTKSMRDSVNLIEIKSKEILARMDDILYKCTTKSAQNVLIDHMENVFNFNSNNTDPDCFKVIFKDIFSEKDEFDNRSKLANCIDCYTSFLMFKECKEDVDFLLDINKYKHYGGFYPNKSAYCKIYDIINLSMAWTSIRHIYRLSIMIPFNIDEYLNVVIEVECMKSNSLDTKLMVEKVKFGGYSLMHNNIEDCDKVHTWYKPYMDYNVKRIQKCSEIEWNDNHYFFGSLALKSLCRYLTMYDIHMRGTHSEIPNMNEYIDKIETILHNYRNIVPKIDKWLNKMDEFYIY